MSSVAQRLTYDDLRQLPDDGKRYELIDGELIVVAAPSPRHQRVSKRLERLFDGHVEATGFGEMFHAPLDVRLSDRVVVEPDIFVVRKERLHIVGRTLVEGAPDLIVEILSPSTREIDVERKFALYARFGVLEYWMVDPETDRIEVFALVGGRYEAIPHDGDVVRSRLLPGFDVDVVALFAGLP